MSDDFQTWMKNWVASVGPEYIGGRTGLWTADTVRAAFHAHDALLADRDAEIEKLRAELLAAVEVLQEIDCTSPWCGDVVDMESGHPVECSRCRALSRIRALAPSGSPSGGEK